MALHRNGRLRNDFRRVLVHHLCVIDIATNTLSSAKLVSVSHLYLSKSHNQVHAFSLTLRQPLIAILLAISSIRSTE